MSALVPHNDNAAPYGPVPAYVELVSTSNFSFLRGGSHPEELALASAALRLKGFGLTDRNSFAGVVRACAARRRARCSRRRMWLSIARR